MAKKVDIRTIDMDAFTASIRQVNAWVRNMTHAIQAMSDRINRPEHLALEVWENEGGSYV